MSGTPVVAFPMRFAPDLVSPDVTDGLTREPNFLSFADQFEAVLRWSPAQRTAAVERCRALALSACSTDAQIGRHLDIAASLKLLPHAAG